MMNYDEIQATETAEIEAALPITELISH